MENFYKNKKIFVTGGTGFIGSNIVDKLVSVGAEVTITGNAAENSINPSVRLLLTNFTGLDYSAVGETDVVFHLAANNDTQDMNEVAMRKSNVDGSKELFFKMYENGCRNFVYATSTAVYGDASIPFNEIETTPNPLNPYAKSKLALEEFAKDFANKFESNTVGLRLCNVYGPGEGHKGRRSSMVYQLAKQIINGERPKLFTSDKVPPGEQRRDLIYIKDVVSAFMYAGEYAENVLCNELPTSAVFNCGYGANISFNQIVDVLNRCLRTNLTPEYVEHPYPDNYQNYTLCDMGLIKEKMGWHPAFDPEDGIFDYVFYGKHIK